MDSNRAVHFDRHTNLLQLEEHMYPLVDVEYPNTFRNLYPYTEIPKIAFNDRMRSGLPTPHFVTGSSQGRLIQRIRS